MSVASRQPNFAVLVLLAWLVAVLQLLLQYWPETALTLNDTDDAMRLVQLRAFLHGQGWFDLHEARVQPPIGYDPHWSRLIDAGLATVYLLMRPFADAAMAERLMRAVWPVLWLLPAIAAVAAIAWRLAGREAALTVLLFAAIGLPAFQQFKPGRIDHHNVQIAIVALAVAATAWSDRACWCAIAAGILTGLGLAVGFEGMPFLVLCGAALALRYAIDPDAADALRGYGFATAASAAALFAATAGHWTQSACDSLAANSTASVVVAGLGLAFLSGRRGLSLTMRGGLVIVVAILAAAAFVLPEPRCLGGPYALVDPAVHPLWLAHVREMQPLLAVFADNPQTGLGIAVFPIAGLVAVGLLARREDLRGDFGFLTASAALLLAVAMMFAAIKGYAYAMWLAMPLVAAMALRLCAVLRLTTTVPRFAAALLFTPLVLCTGAISLAQAAGLSKAEDAGRAEREACFRTASYRSLAKLPPGLMVADIDYGPFLLALTPHSVLAAPYHRLSAGIVEAHRIFASPPEAAHRIVTQTHAAYVAVCGPRAPSDLSEDQRKASLWGQIQAGRIPDWLAAEPASRGTPFRIYRVRS
jgi:hypothetical protein